MATKLGTINIEAVEIPTCSNWSFPPSTFQQDTKYTMSVDVKNNSGVSVTAYLYAEAKGKTSGTVVTHFFDKITISPGETKKLTNYIMFSSNVSLCDTSWTLQNIGVKLEYGGSTHGPYCTQSDRNITLTPNYKGSLGTGHTIPPSAHLGDTARFTIKAKNTNSCFKYNLWAKVTCKLSTDETKQFSGTGSKVSVDPGSTASLPVSVTVPTNIPIGTYNVYAELYVGA